MAQLGEASDGDPVLELIEEIDALIETNVARWNASLARWQATRRDIIRRRMANDGIDPAPLYEALAHSRSRCRLMNVLLDPDGIGSINAVRDAS